MRFLSGPPGNGNPKESSTSTLWVCHEPSRHLDFPALAALADIFYPLVFLRRGHPVPAGTISMTVPVVAAVAVALLSLSQPCR